MKRGELADWLAFLFFVAVLVFLVWILTGCSVVSRTATMEYKNTCSLEILGQENVHGDSIETDFTIGPDCTVRRKGSSKEQVP